MRVMVTGGAGYIGSHAVLALRDAGHEPVVVDNLVTGVRALVPSEVPFFELDAGDIPAVSALLGEHKIDAVMHFAGSVVVPESVADPLKYYRNNTGVSRNLIEACVAASVSRFVFSSTAAVYGIPDAPAVSEDTPLAPINPYGRSKMITEWTLKDAAAATDLGYVILRYFNVAGADPAGRSGQATPHATHLIKVACEVATGQRSHIDLFGDDYDTPDGTCVRDFIHVSDLADAHVRALDYFESGNRTITLNCGIGRGYSVREVLATAETVADAPIDIRPSPRRAGDPPSLIAKAEQIRSVLGWVPKYPELAEMIATALAWEQARADR